MNFHPVESNLRESFRALAFGRAQADVSELPGLTIASLGVAFQMFNAAFLSAPVENKARLAQLVELARLRFESRHTAWSFWVCEDWIASSARSALSRTCERVGLRPVSELPGLAAHTLKPARRSADDLVVSEVDSTRTMQDFSAVGSVCFHVRPGWFAEVFQDEIWKRRQFRSFVGYQNGEPVATSALLVENGSAGIYNVAVLPGHRGKGFGEAITRFAAGAAGPVERLVLQATPQGYGMYLKMGFQPVTRVIVYASA